MYSPLASNGGVSLTPRNKRERKVSLVFRHNDDQKHCAGVESLLLVPNQKLLWTASRDSTVKRWNVSSPAPQHEASFEGHADWVNSVVLVGDLLITGSNDQTVRVWKAGSNQAGDAMVSPLHTLTHHSDYVTALATAPAINTVASAGLRAEIFLINIETGQTQQLYPKSPPEQLATQHTQHAPIHSPMQSMTVAADDASSSHHKGSVYALAMNPAGSLLAAGTTEHLIRLLDPRTRQKITKLRGHLDNVRSLVVNHDGTTIISGAADGTIKIWDVGMQRCIQTYSMHQDSVWSLLASDDFSVLYSGGRDKALYRTQLHSRTTELLVMEQSPIKAMAFDPIESSIWVATTSSTVQKWSVPRESPSLGSGGVDSRSFSARSRAGIMSAGSRGHRGSTDVSRAPVSTSPAAVIRGIPGIVLHKVMSDRRHILSKDSEGNVALWDVLVGAVVESYGQVDFDAKEAELFEAKSMPAWFSSDNRMGQLCITLEPPSCFLAEEYAQNLDVPNASDDHKFNYGKLVLDGAFARWRSKATASMQQQQAGVGVPALASPDGAVYRELWPKYWQCPAQPAVICSTYQGQRWRRLMGQFSGQETEPDEVPTWVADVVLRGANVTPKEAKCAFILLPAEGSNLPSLMQSKLNAPKILQVHKVAHYCHSKLSELNIPLDIRPVYLRRPHHLPPDVPDVAGRHVLEVMCNGMSVPYEMSLASVKKFIWKKQEDLVFTFKVRDPNNPAPLPVLKLGSS